MSGRVDADLTEHRGGVLSRAKAGRAGPNEGLEADLDAAMWWPAYVPYMPA